MALSESDWRRLDSAFTEIKEQIKDSGSKIHKLDKRLLLIEEGSPHKCDAAIKAHELASLTHNPKKALTMLGVIIAMIEGIRSIFHR